MDLVFGWQVLQTVLEEIVQGGMVIDTNINRIVAAVDEANSQKNGNTNGNTISASILLSLSRDRGFWGR